MYDNIINKNWAKFLTVFVAIALIAMSFSAVFLGTTTVKAEYDIPWEYKETQTEEEYQSHIDETKLDLEGTMSYSSWDHTRNFYIVFTYEDEVDGNVPWNIYHIDTDGNTINHYEHDMNGRHFGSIITDDGTLLVSDKGNLRDDDEDMTTAGIYRSTDGGETLTEVKDKVACWEFTEDRSRDIIYAANYWDYNPWEGNPTEYIWKSSDDGQTWTPIWDCEEFDNQTEDWFAKNESLGGNGFKHIHGLQYSPIHDALYVIGGDSYMDNGSAGGKFFGVLKANNEPSQTSDFSWMSWDSQWDSTTYYDNDVYLGCSNEKFSISRITEDVDNSDNFEIDHLVGGKDTSIYQSTTMVDNSGNELGVFSTRYGRVPSIVVTDGEYDLTIQSGTTNYMTWSHRYNMDGLIATAPEDYGCTAVLYEIEDFEKLKKPLPISNAGDLEEAYGARRRRYKLKNDIDFSDVDLTAAEKKYIFSHIEGNGYTINNINALFAERMTGELKNAELKVNRDVSSAGYGAFSEAIAWGLQPISNIDIVGESTLNNHITGILAGYCRRNIDNIDADLSVTLTDGDDDKRGGIIGIMLGDYKISNSEISLDVSGTGNSVDFGGIIGSLNGGTIDNCRVKGNIKPDDADIGGLIFMGVNSKINNCINTADLSSSKKVGGIAVTNKAQQRLSILNTTYDGDITGGQYAGGLISSTEANSTTIKNCYIRGSIESLDSTTRTGGIVGNKLTYNTTIENVYVLTDIVTNVGGSQYKNVIAGYVINNAVKLEDIYYNQESTTAGLWLETDAEPETEIVYEESLENMSKESTYQNWTFGVIWKINEDRNDGYPYLKAEEYVDVDVMRPENLDDSGASLKVKVDLNYVEYANLSFEYSQIGEESWNETEYKNVTEDGTYTIDTGQLEAERYYEYKSVVSYNPTIESNTLSFYEDTSMDHMISNTLEIMVAIIPVFVIFMVISLVMKAFGSLTDGMK